MTMTDPEKLRDVIRSAYLDGAEAVHDAWIAGLGQSEPDFGEAAEDYMASLLGLDELTRPQPPAPQLDLQSRILTGAMAFPTDDLANEVANRARKICEHHGIDPDKITDNYGPVREWHHGAYHINEALAPISAERDALRAKLAAAEATIHKLVNHIKDNRSRSYAFIAALATEKKP